MSEKKFEVKIVESSHTIESGRDQIALKNTESYTPIDSLEDGTHIDIVFWCKLKVHNEFSENKDYTLIVLKSSDGVYYSTSSETFERKFSDIWDDCSDYPEEFMKDNVFMVPIKILRKESNNYKGRFMLMCAID